jgi:hypothetical protein
VTYTTKIFIVAKNTSPATLTTNNKGFWMKEKSTKYTFIL